MGARPTEPWTQATYSKLLSIGLGQLWALAVWALGTLGSLGLGPGHEVKGKARNGKGRQLEAKEGKEGKERQGKRQGKPKQGKAKDGKAMQGKTNDCLSILIKHKSHSANPREDPNHLRQLRETTKMDIAQDPRHPMR